MLLTKLVKHYIHTFSLFMHGAVVILLLQLLANPTEENKGVTRNAADIKSDE